MQEESGIPPSNKRLNKTLKFIKAVALFQVIKDIEFALLHGISFRHYLGYICFTLQGLRSSFEYLCVYIMPNSY